MLYYPHKEYFFAPLTQVVEYFHGKEKVVRASRARGTKNYFL